jgi:hypothetical protein
MPWNVSRSTQFVEKEILKYAQSLDGFPIKSVVLDSSGSTFAMPAGSVRNVVPAGVILKKNPAAPTKYIQYDGTGTIEGILFHSVELLANATNADEPVPMVYHGCVFATAAIVGFTQYASQLVAALTTCKFE